MRPAELLGTLESCYPLVSERQMFSWKQEALRSLRFDLKQKPSPCDLSLPARG